MALDLSLKTGQWPIRTSSSVITAASTISHLNNSHNEINRKSYQLQQNHHRYLETENLSYFNHNSPASSLPISLVKNHHHQSTIITTVPHNNNHNPNHNNHDRHHQVQAHHNKTPITTITTNTHTVHHARRTKIIVNPIQIHDDDLHDSGELLIVEDINDNNDHDHDSSPPSPSPPPEATKNLKRILEEDHDSKTSQLLLSKHAHFVSDYNHHHVTRHLRKSNIFVHPQQQLIHNFHESSNNNRDTQSPTAASFIPTKTITITKTSTTNTNNDHNNHQTQQPPAIDTTNNTNNVISVQHCDSSSSVVSSTRSPNNLITSTTSPLSSTSALTKDELIITSNTTTPSGINSKDKAKKNEAKYTCTHCTKNFKKQSLLDAHMRLMNEKAKWKSFQKKKYIKTSTTTTTATNNNNNADNNASNNTTRVNNNQQ